MTPQRRLIALLAAVLVAASLFAPAAAGAAVVDGDYVGGVKVADAPSLRAVAPDLYVPAGMLTTMDGRELWARDPEGRRPMASTTKIMTALVVLEHSDLSEEVVVDKIARTVGESAMGLRVGERLTVGELLKGVLVQSGNDAATMIAEHVAGSVPAFVRMMNDKARQLDLVNTHYANPHGLDAKGHYTSAEDLTTLARIAMHNDTFRSIVGVYRVKVVSDRYTHWLQSHNVLLKTYKGAEGIKTGWTNGAGYCVVFAAKRGDVELVGTVMGAASEAGRAQQAKKLLDWGFAHYKPMKIATEGDPAGRVRVSDYMERTVAARTGESTTVPVFDIAGPVKRRIELLPDVPAPVKRGDRLGTLTIFQGDRLLAQVPVVAAADVPEPTVWQRVVFFFGKAWRGIVGG